MWTATSVVRLPRISFFGEIGWKNLLWTEAFTKGMLISAHCVCLRLHLALTLVQGETSFP